MRYLKDPLTLFLAFGLIIFFAERLFAGDADSDYLIEITPGQQARIFDQWQAQMGRPPTEPEASGLLEQWIREEIFYREAKKLGLDDNDTIIRRRLAQKLTFLNEDLANAEAPSDAELAAFFQANLDDYLIPERFSFEHRYFSSDRRDDAEADAQAALAEPESAGDPFILQKSYAERSAREIGDLFGRDFADALAGLDRDQPERWQGPIPSAYGWHLIRLIDTAPNREPLMSEVLEAVQRDYLQEAPPGTANESFLRKSEKSLRDRGAGRPLRDGSTTQPRAHCGRCAHCFCSASMQRRWQLMRCVLPTSPATEEVSEGLHRVTWKQPVLGDRRLPLDPVLPEHCEVWNDGLPEHTGAALMHQLGAFAAISASGMMLIDGLSRTLTDVMVRDHAA